MIESFQIWMHVEPGLHGPAWFNPLEVDFPMILFEVWTRNSQRGEHLQETEIIQNYIAKVSSPVSIIN